MPPLTYLENSCADTGGILISHRWHEIISWNWKSQELYWEKSTRSKLLWRWMFPGMSGFANPPRIYSLKFRNPLLNARKCLEYMAAQISWQALLQLWATEKGQAHSTQSSMKLVIISSQVLMLLKTNLQMVCSRLFQCVNTHVSHNKKLDLIYTTWCKHDTTCVPRDGQNHMNEKWLEKGPRFESKSSFSIDRDKGSH